MKNTWAIFKKELKSYTYSPVAYIVVAHFLLITGYFFYSNISWINEMMRFYGPQQQFDVNRALYEPFFLNTTILLMILIPLLTMRLFAEEKKMKTEEMLLTSPIRIGSLIMGKFLAALAIYSVILLLTATYSIVIFLSGSPALEPILTAYLGLLLMGAAFIALGLFASSLTENQVVAAVISSYVILLIWVIYWIGETAGQTLKEILTYLSFYTHFQNMVKGVLDTQDVVYFLSFSFLALYLTYSVFEFRKWR